MSNKYMTTRRKLAIASWAAPKEGNIYGKLSVDVEQALQYINRVNQSFPEGHPKITITHFVGKVLGKVLSEIPSLNGQIILGTYRPHSETSISFLVKIEDKADLGKVKIENIDSISFQDLAYKLKGGVKSLRTGKDESFEKSKNLLRLLPTWLIRPILYVSGYLSGVLGVEIKAIGLESYPFGVCIITSVGMLDLDEGFAPPTPFARVPYYVAITKIKKRAVVNEETNKIEVRQQLDLCATLDHRFLDGMQAAQMVKQIRHYFANPEELEKLK